MEKGESRISTALREGGEELTGFLGDAKEISKIIKKNGYYHINHKDQYHVHVIKVPYDENLPKYYNNNHVFLWKRNKSLILQYILKHLTGRTFCTQFMK